MRRLFTTLAVLAVAAPLIAAAPAGSIDVVHPWSRPAPAGGNGVGYVTLTNTGKAADRLLSVSTPAAQRVEMHRSMVMNGMAMMHPVEGGLPIPPGATAVFAPGGYHLMLVGLKQPLALGASVPVTLKFEKAGPMTVSFAVETGKADAMAGMPGMRH
jgi:copper(I)-binding protein